MSDKTNAVRKCESAGLDFDLFTYDLGGEAVDGKSVWMCLTYQRWLIMM